METTNFQLDYCGETQKVKKHWQFCVGSCHAALAQRADYLEQLKLVHDELGMQRVRFHGLFDDDMNVCQQLGKFLPVAGLNKTKLYNFYQIGKIYDNLLRIGVKPFVEIGFMPSALASGKKTVFYYKGNVTMPKSLHEWQNFIRMYAHFLINRYGAEEVRTWYFEVWNEPDLPCFFKGSMNDYYKLYAATVRALKSVDDKLQVGGPATTRSRFLPEFIDYCKSENVPVDFISTHQYPTDALGHSINKERLKQISKLKIKDKSVSISSLLQPVFDNVNDFTPELKGYMTREMKKAREQVGDLPLYYTEWSISSNCVAAIHDTTRCSSFLVKTVLDVQNIIDGSSYWTFSDIFEELFFFPEPFCGGFGLLTVDGIPKPTYWAFKLLSKLSDERYTLKITDDDVEMTAFKGENDSLFLMLYAQNFDNNNKTYNTSITINNSPKFSNAIATRINSSSGNPVAIWESMGKPSSFTREQVDEIKNATKPKTETIAFENADKNSVLNISISENEVILVELNS